LPVPGGPQRRRLGRLPSLAITCRREMASVLPTMSDTVCGRYFSTHGVLAADMMQKWQPKETLVNKQKNSGGDDVERR
jgi:hypothetical protein